MAGWVDVKCVIDFTMHGIKKFQSSVIFMSLAATTKNFLEKNVIVFTS
jgi:hypothetical protein